MHGLSYDCAYYYGVDLTASLRSIREEKLEKVLRLKEEYKKTQEGEASGWFVQIRELQEAKYQLDLAKKDLSIADYQLRCCLDIAQAESA